MGVICGVGVSAAANVNRREAEDSHRMRCRPRNPDGYFTYRTRGDVLDDRVRLLNTVGEERDARHASRSLMLTSTVHLQAAEASGDAEVPCCGRMTVRSSGRGQDVSEW